MLPLPNRTECLQEVANQDFQQRMDHSFHLSIVLGKCSHLHLLRFQHLGKPCQWQNDILVPVPQRQSMARLDIYSTSLHHDEHSLRFELKNLPQSRFQRIPVANIPDQQHPSATENRVVAAGNRGDDLPLTALPLVTHATDWDLHIVPLQSRTSICDGPSCRGSH